MRTALGALAICALVGMPLTAYAAPEGDAPTNGTGALPGEIAAGADSGAATDDTDAPAPAAHEQPDGGAQSAAAPESEDASAVSDAAMSGGEAVPTAPQAQRAPSSLITPIAEIQKTNGTDDDSAMLKTKVTTMGRVTAVFPTKQDGLSGTFDGFYIQTPGTGGAWDPARESSDAVFVYAGKKGLSFPEVGQCVQVTGYVNEYSGKKKDEDSPGILSLTQIASPSIEAFDGECLDVAPVPLPGVPTAEQMEALEGMLVAPGGTWTITDNYAAGQSGTLSITPGDAPLRSATDVVAPGDAAKTMEEENAAKQIVLDDGTNTYLHSGAATNAELAYLANGSPARVGYRLSFTSPVLLDSRNQAFVFQPTTMVAGHRNLSPVSISGERPGAPSVGGDVTIATFNVLNYFTDLGEDFPDDCPKAYEDREKNKVTVKQDKNVSWKCPVRGAYSAQAFANQQAKIVQAINTINADVVALEEIENPVGAGVGDDRDAALKKLVDALNANSHGDAKWAFVPSPAAVPDKEDAIRTAFIYQPARITAVGESIILDDPAFTGLARQPLAQEFAPVVDDQHTGTNIVVIANHFKSKGSVPKGMEEGNTDTGDGQGNSNAIRVAQARALADFATQFEQTPTLLVGDFNAYTMEDPLTVLREKGWVHKSGGADASYVYGGRSGSLDHVFANAAGDGRVVEVASWALNAQESVSFEYSRANYNAHLKFESDNPYRSSDHNPEIVGLALISEVVPAPQPSPEPTPGGTDGGATPTATPTLAATGANTDAVALIGIVLLGSGLVAVRARKKSRG